MTKHATTIRHAIRASLLVLSAALSLAAGAAPPSPESVLADYVKAIGGRPALDRIETREIHAKRGRSAKLTYFWQKPNKFLLIEGKKRIGYDGGSGWMLSSKKRVSKLPKGAQKPLEMDANPLRFADLPRLYSELKAAPGETLDNRAMDVVIAPNELGSTKFYFERSTHLLARIEETGESSAYFKHTTEFSDYQEQDGVKLPFRILHDSTEPGAGQEEIRVREVIQNVTIKPEIFSKPTAGAVTLGGKR